MPELIRKSHILPPPPSLKRHGTAFLLIEESELRGGRSPGIGADEVAFRIDRELKVPVPSKDLKESCTASGYGSAQATKGGVRPAGGIDQRTCAPIGSEDMEIDDWLKVSNL